MRMYMYVHTYMYVRMYVHTYVHALIHVHIHTYNLQFAHNMNTYIYDTYHSKATLHSLDILLLLFQVLDTTISIASKQLVTLLCEYRELNNSSLCLNALLRMCTCANVNCSR